MDDMDYLIKLIIIGESGVGKTSILTMYCDQFFTNASVNTIGVDFKIKNIETNGKKIKLQVWDTTGNGKSDLFPNNIILQ